MFILQVFGDALGTFVLNFFRRCAKGFVGFAAFLRAAHVGGGVGEGNARFRHPDKFHRMLRGDRERKRFRIGEPDVFARKNHDAARDETKVFSGMEHFRQPINRAFFVRRAHAFDERADRVVVRVAFFVVDDRLLLDAVFCDRVGEVNDAFVVGRRRENADFEGVQTFPGIAIA